MTVMRQWKWLVPVLLLVLLLAASQFRWQKINQKAKDYGYDVWLKDRWTGTYWVEVFYHRDDGVLVGRIPAEPYAPFETAEEVREHADNITEIAWGFAAWFAAVWYGICLWGRIKQKRRDKLIAKGRAG